MKINWKGKTKEEVIQIMTNDFKSVRYSIYSFKIGEPHIFAGSYAFNKFTFITDPKTSLVLYGDKSVN